MGSSSICSSIRRSTRSNDLRHALLQHLGTLRLDFQHGATVIGHGDITADALNVPPNSLSKGAQDPIAVPEGSAARVNRPRIDPARARWRQLSKEVRHD